MRRPGRVQITRPGLAVLAVSAALAPAALAQSTTTPAPTTPAPTTTPPPPAAGGRVALTLGHVYGHPSFALVGARVVVYGNVRPFFPGQRVVVRFYINGRKVHVQELAVASAGHNSGRFALGYTSPRTGVLTVTATHIASPQQVEFTSPTKGVRVLAPSAGFGARGPAVRLLQSLLNGLHYAVPLSGVFDDATGRAVIAYRKYTYLSRIPFADARMFRYLAGGAGAFHVLFRNHGKHVEADLTRQVLALIDPGGHVHAIYTLSSGKPSTPTVIGHFAVYLKTPGTNSEGMVDSNYFIRGYAIHGYADVPTYAASHGCLRVPIPNAATIYGWLQIGNPVDVYTDSGHGSRVVRSNAGP
jgi:lipoprotein-anchoring transpeptidase ErfK/SrfK